MKKTLAGLVLVLTLIISLAGVHGVSAADWANQVKLTIDRTKISSTLTNFPVLINLSASSGINDANLSAVFTELGSDANRKKISVTTADGSECYVEVEKWDTAAKQAVLWVKVPSLSSSTDTVLYLNYDPNQADNTARVGDPGSAAARNVWDGDYKTVLHMGDYQDSSAAGHHASAGSSSAAPVRSSGKIGDSQSFNGSDYIQIPDHNDFSVSTTGELTVSFWLSPNVQNMTKASNGYVHFLGKGSEKSYEWAFRIYNANYRDRPQAISTYHWNPSGDLGAGSRWDHSNIPNGSWVYVTGRFGRVDGCSDISLIGNGRLADTDTYSSYNIRPTNGSSPLKIGTRSNDSWLNGKIDEFRVSRVARSDAWISASFENEGDNLIRFGTP